MSSFAQNFGSAPRRFRVAIPLDSSSNHWVAVDFFSLPKDNAFSVVCCGTSVAGAEFVPDLSSEMPWDAFVCIWMTNYVGAPNQVVLDQATHFQ